MTRATQAVARFGVAAMWVHQGVWCKVLRRDNGRHAHIIQDALPKRLAALGSPLTCGLGAGELALAVWVLSGRAPTAAAITQSAAVIAMNAGGLSKARTRIDNPARLLIRNVAFLATVWVARHD